MRGRVRGSHTATHLSLSLSLLHLDAVCAYLGHESWVVAQSAVDAWIVCEANGRGCKGERVRARAVDGRSVVLMARVRACASCVDTSK